MEDKKCGVGIVAEASSNCSWANKRTAQNFVMVRVRDSLDLTLGYLYYSMDNFVLYCQYYGEEVLE
jgi:hypothetical protein